MKQKRKTQIHWMQSRLRRLRAKINAPKSPWAANYNDISDESIARCRKRVNEISDTLFAIWEARKATSSNHHE